MPCGLFPRLAADWMLSAAVLVVVHLAACRTPDRAAGVRDGPGVVIVDAVGVGPVVPVSADPEPRADSSWCLEEWRVGIPPQVRLWDVGYSGDKPVLLVGTDGSFLAATVGDGGQAVVAVLQDFVPEFVAGRVPWGLVVSGPERAMAAYGWISPREKTSLFTRGVRPAGDLAPGAKEPDARKRYMAAEPEPVWEFRCDPSVPESRVWAVPIETRFLVVMDLWQSDRLVGGRLEPIQRHQFALLGATGRKIAGWEMRPSRGAPPATLGDLAVVAVRSDDRRFEVLNRSGRREPGPLADALRGAEALVPVGGGGFLLLAPEGHSGPGIPTLDALAPDGTRSEWPVPAELRGESTIEAVAGGLLWARRGDEVWAADSSGRVVARTRLPAGAVMRRYSADGSRIVAAIPDAESGGVDVVSCIPGGSRAEPARTVPLGGAVESVRREAAGALNDAILAALDAVVVVASATTPAPPARLRGLIPFDQLRRMAARAATLDPDLLVLRLSRARIEMLAGDAGAALDAYRAVESAEPGRRDRLRRLACQDGRFRALRRHPDIGAALGCPELPPEWSVRPDGDADVLPDAVPDSRPAVSPPVTEPIGDR